jgi:nucleoside 2-deoxyribosyltransferase
MKLIYIAGPITSPTNCGREKNVRSAEEEALSVLRAGAAVFCPHTQARFYDGELSWEEWIARDLEVLKRCDALYLISGWQNSRGAVAEHAFAVANNIPFFENYWKLREWLTHVQ